MMPLKGYLGQQQAKINNDIIISWGCGSGCQRISYPIAYKTFARPVVGPGQDGDGHIILDDWSLVSFYPAARINGRGWYADRVVWIIIGV